VIVVIDTDVLVNALWKPTGVAFRLLRLLNGLAVVDVVVTDISGWEFMRIASDLGFGDDEIAEFLDAFDRLFSNEVITESPISRRLLGNALDNVTLERAALALTGRAPTDFRDEIPPPLQSATRGRDSNDLHVVWAVVHHGADVLCALDTGFDAPLGKCEVMTPRELLDELSRM
jgi:predicted nucleic acid-binding protein